MKLYNHFHSPFGTPDKPYLMANLDGRWYVVFSNGEAHYHYKQDYSENVARGIWRETELPANFKTPNFR